MYYIVKLSSGWYAKQILSVRERISQIEEHVDSGEIVVITDDLETFAETMGIKVSDIKVVD